MSIAQELDEQFEQFSIKGNARHIALTKLAGSLASKFPDYLGLTSKKWNKSDGSVGGSRVTLGTGGPENFQEVPWMQLTTKTDGSINFSIAYMLVSPERANKQLLVMEMSIKIQDDCYLVTMKHNNQPVAIGAEDVEKQDFSPVYDVLVSGIKKVTDPDTIIIPVPE